MNPKRTAGPVAEPLTLAEAKAHLRVTVNDDDTLITALISAAREACEDRLQRTLISTPWLLALDAFPDAIKLPMPPALQVQSLQYFDATGTLVTLAGEDYELDPYSEPAYLVPAPGVAWPAIQTGRINAVRVAYTAGYGATAADVPGPIKQWLRLAIGDMYERRTRSAERPAVPQGFADGLLDTYRVWSL